MPEAGFFLATGFLFTVDGLFEGVFLTGGGTAQIYKNGLHILLVNL